MKSLDELTIAHGDECAGLVMETVPLLMRTMRREMRQRRPAELSMPQFRALRVLHRHPRMSLSDLAQRLDLTLASTSKLIDVLVKHDLVQRDGCPTDRRRIELQLSEHGHASLSAVWQAAHARLAEALAQLNAEERAVVSQAMRALQSVLSTDPQSSPDSGPAGIGC